MVHYSKYQQRNEVSMSTVTVVAKVVAKKEAVEAVKTELLKMIEPTRQESGCIEYRLHEDTQNPTEFIFYENWESSFCLEQHMNSLHFKAYVAAVDNLLADKLVHIMTEIG